jgi:hypothetical protein
MEIETVKRMGNWDLLVFQLLNWSGGFVLFSSFARNMDSLSFAVVGRAEIFLGCVGMVLFTTSVRRHRNGLSKQHERPVLLMRVAAFAVAFTGYVLGLWSSVYVFALLAFVSVPTHLPLLQGYTPVVYALLLLRFVVAGMSFAVSKYQLDTESIAAIYFAPTILYGFGSYLYHWRRLPTLPSPLPLTRAGSQETFGSSWLLSFVATALCYAVQAQFVSQLIRTNWELASIERLIRSGYSFCFPHSIRLGLWTKPVVLACIIVLVVFLALVIALHSSIPVPFLMVGPFLLDIFSSALAGRYAFLDLGFALMLLMTMRLL